MAISWIDGGDSCGPVAAWVRLECSKPREVYDVMRLITDDTQPRSVTALRRQLRKRRKRWEPVGYSVLIRCSYGCREGRIVYSLALTLTSYHYSRVHSKYGTAYRRWLDEVN